MSTEVCCLPCKRAKIGTSENLKWCVECSELICEKCAKFHGRFKFNYNHTLLKVTKEDAAEIVDFIMPQYCKAHPEEKICFLCEDHKTICCKICIALQHEKCSRKQGTDVLGKSLKSSRNSDNLILWTRKLKQKAEALKMFLDSNLTELKARRAEILADIQKKRNEINAVMNEYERKVIADFEDKITNVEFSIALHMQTLISTEIEATRLQKAYFINKDNATNTQFLLAIRDMLRKKTTLEDRIKTVHCQGLRNVHWTLGDFVSDVASNLQLHEDTVVMEELAFPSVHTKLVALAKQDVKYVIIGVNLLEDGRILILDQSGPTLRLFANELKQIHEILVEDAREIVTLNTNFIAVRMTGSKRLKLFKLNGNKITSNGELQVAITCFSMTKLSRNSVLLLCPKGKRHRHFRVYPDEVTFKLLVDDRTLYDFSLPVTSKLSPGRGFAFDSKLNQFVAINEDGNSILWIDESGTIVKKVKFVGRGGISGLAVDDLGHVYTTSDHKIYEISETGKIVNTVATSINIHNIAVSEMGNRIIAVGHYNTIEVITLLRSD